MSNPLDKLLGMQLEACAGADPELLFFSACHLAAFNRVVGSDSASALLGKTVCSIDFSSGEMLRIGLGESSWIGVSLADEDYSGPEAFCATFSDGTIVVE